MKLFPVVLFLFLCLWFSQGCSLIPPTQETASTSQSEKKSVSSKTNTTNLPPTAQVATCEACDLIEKKGEGALLEIEKMPYNQLIAQDKEGASPFFWSVYYGNDSIRDFLISTLKTEDFRTSPKERSLISACSGSLACTTKNISLLSSLGFKSDERSLISTFQASDCQNEKFQTLLSIGAPLPTINDRGQNLLHRLVERSVQNGPACSKEDLSSMITKALKKYPKLAKEQDSERHTPLQKAIFLRDNLKDSKISPEIIISVVETLKTAVK